MYQSNKLKWSFLAGLFDGEGSFSISHQQGRNGKDSTGLFVRIPNTSVKLMEWLVQHFGGKYYLVRTKPGYKPNYEWSPKGRQNREQLLLGILPYLVIKDEQCKVALEYLRLPQNPYDTSLTQTRNTLKMKMNLLNQRGQSLTTNMSGTSAVEVKIESDLIGDYESDPSVN